jgi:hypothetical protein
MGRSYLAGTTMFAIYGLIVPLMMGTLVDQSYLILAQSYKRLLKYCQEGSGLIA